MTRPLTAGLDLGSTNIKLLVIDPDGRELVVAQQACPWRPAPGNGTEMGAPALAHTVRTVFEQAAAQLSADGLTEPVEAIAVSGMGESGFLAPTAAAVPVPPAIAWFDPRGDAQVAAIPVALRAEFAARTGLPLGVQLSVAKLLLLRDSGTELRGRQWLNLPEYVAAALGGRCAAEYSLASRTGLLDQDTGRAWPQLLAHLGVDDDFLPPLVAAGTDLGPATAGWLPDAFRGARITVAGHDHLVAASAGGARADGRYYGSFGTAEVLVRILDEPLDAAARTRLTDYLINYVRHVEPGQYVLVAGVKTGLLMRRVLQVAGIFDRAGRDRLDEQVLALPVGGALPPGAIAVHGARNDDGVLSMRINSDGVSPAELFAAVLRHGNAELARLIEVMDCELPPARATVLAGGWASMRSVQRARAEVLPDLTASTRAQDTAYGAAVVARRLLSTASSAPPVRSTSQEMPQCHSPRSSSARPPD